MNNNRRNVRLVVTIIVCMTLSAPALLYAESPLPLVPALDPQRYSGLWFEIARYPQFYENGLVGVTAEYDLQKDGSLSVTNAGYKGDLGGERSVAHAVARIPDPKAPGALKLSFFGIFSSDYLVFGLDAEGYSWALVGDNARKQLWFLSRKPRIDQALRSRMEAIAVANGYDLSKLYWVPQP